MTTPEIAADRSPTAALIHLRRSRPHAPRYQALLDHLNDGAVTSLRDSGWQVALLGAADEPLATVRAAARRADVVVILGGEDVDPSAYGAPDRRPHPTAYDTEGDHAQLSVVRDAVASRRPLLGVCRGMQLINVALGGSLHQHIKGHRGTQDAPFVPTDVRFDDPALVGTDGERLCSHHQSVDRLADGLEVTARAADGTVEVFRHRELPILGYQWHLEHPASALRQFAAVAASFVAASRPGR